MTTLAFLGIWAAVTVLLLLGWYALRGGPRRDQLDAFDELMWQRAVERRQREAERVRESRRSLSSAREVFQDEEPS